MAIKNTPEAPAIEKTVAEVTVEEVSTVEKTEKVKVLKDINNAYIAGSRYTLREGETAVLPVYVAHVLKNSGKVI